MSDLVSLQGFYVKFSKACADAGGQSAWGRAHGITPQYVSDVMRARQEPNDKLLAALGLRRVVMFKVIGEQK